MFPSSPLRWVGEIYHDDAQRGGQADGVEKISGYDANSGFGLLIGY
jgi:hypothetical protein